MYRARVARATYNACQSDARIKSHDSSGMNGMQINHCACLYTLLILGTQWNVNLFAFLIHAHVPEIRHTFLGDTGPIHVCPDPFSPCVKGGWARDYCLLLLSPFHPGW